MINFIESKKFNKSNVMNLLKESYKTNQWTNFGPVSLLLEKTIEKIIQLNKNHKVITCCNASLGLWALVEMLNFKYNKKLKWVISDFGFPCTISGPLQNSIVVDCNSFGLLDLNKINNIEYDGIIATNVFGLFNMQQYKEFCILNKKELIIDSATAFDGIEHNQNEIISFHHTKPWGFGEGGCVVIDKQDEKLFRSIINSGISEGVFQFGMNAKLSDISAAFIIDRLKSINVIKEIYQEQYERVKNIAYTCGFKELYKKETKGTPCHIPLVSNNAIKNINNSYITLKKYYKPLTELPCAEDLYKIGRAHV